MKRRALLASVGAGFAGLAGCSGVVEEFDPGGDTPSDDSDPPGGRPDGSTVACSELREGFNLDAVRVRNLPGVGDRFSDLGCPTFDWAARTVCYHTARLPDEDVVLISRNSRVFVGGEDGTVEFALVNRTGQQISTQPSAWTILEPDGDEWSLVASDGPVCTRYIPHEGVHWWNLGLDRRLTSGFLNVTAANATLSAGVYAFAVPAFLPGGDIVCVAPFEVVRTDGADTGTPIPDDGATPGDDGASTPANGTAAQTPVGDTATPDGTPR